MANSSRILDQIAHERSKNNSPWMNLIAIALQYAPSETIPVLEQILAHDRKIGGLLEDLIDANRRKEDFPE